MNIDAGDVIAVLVAFGGLILAWRKAPGEKAVMSADAAAKFQEIAVKAAQREEDMRTRIEALEKQQGEYEERLRRAEEKAARWEDWARRLSFQVQSMGGTPVPFDPDDGRVVGK